MLTEQNHTLICGTKYTPTYTVVDIYPTSYQVRFDARLFFYCGGGMHKSKLVQSSQTNA